MTNLEGPALKAYLLMRRQMMKEAARINNMSDAQAWGITIPPPEAVTFENLLPSPDAALKITDLEPEDLGVTCNSTTEWGYKYSLAAGENAGVISKTIDNGRVVGIYGISVLSIPMIGYPATSGYNATAALIQIDVNIGGREARVWPVQNVYDTGEKRIFFFDPIIITEAKTLTIDLWAATAADVRLTWLGLYAEPKE
jgi:hypothetical protein